MNWFTDTVERWAGLDPAKIDPALPAISRLIGHAKKLEADYKEAKPDIDAALKEWDIIEPAVEQVLKLFGLQVGAGIPPAQATGNIVKSIHLADPSWNVPRIQTELHQLGFDPGPIDGKFGEKTANAVKAYQKSRGLRPDGWPGPVTIDAFKKEPT